jgi:chromosome segregation ATPase
MRTTESIEAKQIKKEILELKCKEENLSQQIRKLMFDPKRENLPWEKTKYAPLQIEMQEIQRQIEKLEKRLRLGASKEEKEARLSKMRDERVYTNEVLAFLKNEFNRYPGYVDRMVGNYRIKIHNEEVAKKVAAHFPGVIAKLVGASFNDDGGVWGVKVPFVKPF